MTPALLFATAILIAARPAPAANDPMSAYYGATLVASGGGIVLRTHYRPDHSFDMTGSMMGMSRTFRGTWKIDAKGQLCRTFIGEVPMGSPNNQCKRFTPHKLGQSWTIQTPSGATTLSLKPGVE